MLNTTRLHIPAMNTAHATRAVSDTLVQIQGVADIGVNADEGLVEVKYDPDKTDSGAIRTALERAGYRTR